jgi:hypothetical protein
VPGGQHANVVNDREQLDVFLAPVAFTPSERHATDKQASIGYQNSSKLPPLAGNPRIALLRTIRVPMIAKMDIARQQVTD